MKRTKSVLSMRNLAASIKQSIQLDANRTPPFQPLNTTKSLVNLLPHHSQNAPKQTILHQEHKDNRIFVLEKQIATLEKQLKFAASDHKNYDHDLNLYDSISKKLTESQNSIAQQKACIQQTKNQILMLQEEISSTKFNKQENMAEKQYHEQFIETYGNQYEAESKLVFSIVDLELKNQIIQGEIKHIEQSTGKSQEELQQWKDEIQFDLNQHKLKNSIKIIRMKLIGLEDQCDAFCLDNNLRKLRELYCLYFKNYAKANGASNEEAQAGIDVFICQRGLCEDFSEFVRERLVYNKPKFALLEQYLTTLGAMEQVYRKSIFQANRKIHALLQQDIKQLQINKEQKEQEIQSNQQRIKQLNDQIDDLFNNESIAVIEYMREKNRNKYDLKEIKAKLRQNKKEQKKRIARIRDSFNKIRQLERILEKTSGQQIAIANQSQMEELTQTLIQAELSQEELQRTYGKQRREKEAIEDSISNEITRWRQLDEKKNKLKSLYQQLESAKKLQVDWQDKPEYKITKNHHQISIDYHKAPAEQEKMTRCDPLDESKSIKQHSKQASSSSLNQSKSVLSLTNPFKRIIEKTAKETYQPILNNCQMILSRKLTQKDLQINDLESRSSNILQEKTQNAHPHAQSKKTLIKLQQKSENSIWSAKNKSMTTTPYKQTVPMAINSKGKICMSQRESLSKLLISKFHR